MVGTVKLYALLVGLSFGRNEEFVSQASPCDSIARVFRRDSHPARSRRSEGSGGESSSMLISVEGNAVQAFSMLL
jgi:hypothetical protein